MCQVLLHCIALQNSDCQTYSKTVTAKPILRLAGCWCEDRCVRLCSAYFRLVTSACNEVLLLQATAAAQINASVLTAGDYTVYITGVAPSVSNADLVEFASHYGEVCCPGWC